MNKIFIQYDFSKDSFSQFYVINNGSEKDVTIVVCDANYNIPITIISIVLCPGLKYWFHSQNINDFVFNSDFSGFRYLIIDNKTFERYEIASNYPRNKKIDITLPDIYLLGDSFIPFYNCLYTNKLSYLFENRYNGWYIDLGANLGAYASLSIQNGYNDILLVEPSELLISSLKQTFAEHENVKIECAAVTNKNLKEVSFQINDAAQVANFVSNDGQNLVKNFRISELVKKHDISEIALLKIDIEGQEFEVLRGIEKWVLDMIHSISLETHLTFESDDSLLVEILTNAGFKHQLVSTNETKTHNEHFFWK